MGQAGPTAGATPGAPSTQPTAGTKSGMSVEEMASLARQLDADRQRSLGFSPAGGKWTDPGTGSPWGESQGQGGVFEGNFMTPSIYNNLFAICREAGLSEAYSRGVIRGFARW